MLQVLLKVELFYLQIFIILYPVNKKSGSKNKFGTAALIRQYVYLF